MLNWYLQSGNDSDVVLSTRIRTARNIKGFPFVNRYTKKDALKIIEIVEEAVNSLGYGLKVIKLKDLDLSLIKEGVYVFFQTNWDQYFEDEEKYNNHPEISIEVIKYLVDKNVNMIGIDTLGLGVSKNHGIIDKYLGDHKMYAIENLCNLKNIPNKNFKVYCLPMKIEGLDGYPARILVEF